MSEYNEHGFLKDGLATPEQVRRYCGNEAPGKIIALGHAPPGLLIIKRFLDPGTCRNLVDYANSQPGVVSTVQKTDAGHEATLESRISSERVTEYIDVGGIEDNVVNFMREIITGQIAAHYDVVFEWFERPEILRYKPGGFYKPHADADNWDRAQGVWTRGMDRDFSLLIYLNDDFSGGELEFSQFGFLIRPEAGMLVCFPSDHRYVHAARPTKQGIRYAIVSWAAARGSRRIHDSMPPGAISC